MSEPQWQTCPKCGERWWDSHVCRNTLNSLTVALAPTCRFCGQASRAQPAQAGQVLTDVELAALMPPPDIDGSKARSPNAVRLAMRAVEAAVLAKRVPMTEAQIDVELDGSWVDDPADFEAGIRAAERHHGIVGEKGGA